MRHFFHGPHSRVHLRTRVEKMIGPGGCLSRVDQYQSKKCGPADRATWCAARAPAVTDAAAITSRRFVLLLYFSKKTWIVKWFIMCHFWKRSHLLLEWFNLRLPYFRWIFYSGKKSGSDTLFKKRFLKWHKKECNEDDHVLEHI